MSLADRPSLQSARSGALALAIVFAAVALCHGEPTTLPEGPFPGVSGPPPGVYGSALLLIPDPAVVPAPEYRFVGQTSWSTLDRPLLLSAFVGEERTYALELRRPPDQPQSLAYTIDRRPPEPPSFAVPSGFAGASLTMGLSGSDDICISVDGSAFVRFDPDSVQTFVSPADATRILHASAYCVDKAGNVSRMAQGVWLLAPAGVKPSISVGAGQAMLSIQSLTDAAGLGAELVDLDGSARLILRVPQGTHPIVAVNPVQPFSSIASYAELPDSVAGAACEIAYPWGYPSEIVVYYGYQSDGVLHIAPAPLRLSPRFSANQPVPVADTPLEPRIVAVSSGVTVEWPPSPLLVMVSVDGGEFKPYGGPMTLVTADVARQITYYVQDSSGSKSSTRSLQLPVARPAARAAIAGFEAGAVYGGSVLVRASNDQRIAYELTDDGSVPPPVTDKSALVPAGGLKLEGKAGSVVGYQLRLLPQNVGDGDVVERFVCFSVDRQPPPVPQLSTAIDPSGVDQVIAFKPQEGNIFVSISKDGKAPFVRYDGPITMTGTDDGRMRYTIQSYAEDEFGNRSAPMAPLHLLVDRYSLYVDSGGAVGATGSPDDPMRYLDEAIALAAASDKRFIYIRGTVALRKPVTVERTLTIAGGFDADWNDSPSSVATITMRGGSALSSPFVNVRGGNLGLEALSIAMGAEGSATAIHAELGTLSMRRVSMTAAGGTQIVALSANGSDISISGSSIDMSASASARGLDLQGNHLRIDGLSIGCASSVRLFEAIRLADMDATVTGLRIDASPDYALSGLFATRSSVNLSQAIFLVRGGSASCRLVGVDRGALDVSSSYIDSGWNGSAQVFSASDGATIRVAHVTTILDSPRTTFMDLSASYGSINNSIVQSRRGSTLLYRADSAPASGSIGANCLWGVGTYLSGPAGATTLPELNRIAAPGTPNFIEDPAKTFAGLAKGVWRLSGASACVDGGEPVAWASRHDLFGSARVSARGAARPDVGAEEF